MRILTIISKSIFVFLVIAIIYSLTIFLKQNLNFGFGAKTNLKKDSKIHISYVHYLDTVDNITIENFKYFLHFAYEPCNADVDFTIILNVNNLNQPIFERDLLRNAFGNSTRLMNEFQSCQNSKNPKRNTFLIVRQNKDGGDLCAHAELVKSDFWLKNRDRYLYYFFINSSARGPFLPNYWRRKW
jgi:predicted RND superfamily exporter protein